jgi:RNA polymerase sigma-70 factor (ECF subfamily)
MHFGATKSREWNDDRLVLCGATVEPSVVNSSVKAPDVSIRGKRLTKEAAPISEVIASEAAPISIQELFKEHAPAISSLGFGMLHNAHDADDLVQDVFLRAWRALNRLRNRSVARSWLTTIAVRLALTRLRRRRLARVLFQLDDPSSEQAAEPASVSEHGDLAWDLYRILDQLPAELRVAWILRHIYRETVQDIADLCGWSLSTAKRRIRAADARIAPRLPRAVERLR